MGIKKWLLIGAGLIMIGGTILGFRRKRISSEEKVEQIIQDVDCPSPAEKTEEAVNKMADDVDQAIDEMDITEEDLAGAR